MGGEKKVRCDGIDRRSGKKQREEEVVVAVEKSMADARKVIVDEDQAAKAAALPNQVEEPAGVDDIMLHIDDDELIFSEDNFPSLPDFPCISSPSATPSQSSAANTALSSCSSASSSSSSSSSAWSFLQVPEDASVSDMQPPAAAVEVPSAVHDIIALPPPPSLMLDHHQSSEFSDVGLDILGDIDLFDLSVDPWDPSSLLIHPDEVGLDVGDGGGDGVADLEAMKMSHGVEDSCGGEGGVQQPQEESSSEEDLARIFLEWLRNNKDSISPEDLRSIKLKRATIESAASRLGRNKQGRLHLLKLILTWVQNFHLQRKRQLQQPVTLPPPFPYENHQHRQCPVAPPLDYNYAAAAAADSNFAPGCKSWMRYPMDPSATGGVAQHPALVNAYGGDMVYPGAVAPPYPYHHGTGSVVVNSQPFSPTADFVDPAGSGHEPWPLTQLASALAPQYMVPSPQYTGGGFAANQFLGHPMYHQGGGQRLAGVASATKEARKKRMARQRRFSSLHYHRNHGLQQQSPHPAIGGAAETMANGAAHPSAKGWAFWGNMTSSAPHLPDAHIPSNMQLAAAPPPAAQQQQQNSRSQQQSSVSTTEKRQGWKGEKNLKFLLQKVLKQSDVGSLGRIVLPKKEAETHLPELDARDGISIPMEDIGTSQVWNMRYRFWPNNKSRMYLLENTGDFVRSNGLQEGDFIVIYSDVKCGKYMIRGVKVRQPVESTRPAAAAAAQGRINSTAGGGGGGGNKAHQRRASVGGLEKTMNSPRAKAAIGRMREETEKEDDA